METAPVRLRLLQPNLAPVLLNFSEPVITFGRATECTVPIKDRYLSRRHAEIVYSSGGWHLRDCGSANGTMLNGTRVVAPMPLRPGDRIMLGDTEVIFGPGEDSKSQIIAFDSQSQARNLAIPLREAIDSRARTGVLASLALQFIEDRSTNELFEFILDRVMELLQPSRAALALLGGDRESFDDIRFRRSDDTQSLDLYISRTLLGEVIEERNVVAFVDTSQDEKLARAESIIAQDIRSAVCAPVMIGEDVVGVLYLDFLANRGTVTHEEVLLVAQIARFAAVKLETTRLRDEAIEKAKLDEELRTAYVIQTRILPKELPAIPGYTFAAKNKPCNTVSGDYYDVIVRPDGKIYFIIADVSGKGITAALVMVSVATAFNIFARVDPSPADLIREMNATLTPKTAPKFITMVVGVLDPATGTVEFANAGHVPPLVVSPRGGEQLSTTDIVVGLFPQAAYRNQRVTLEAGDSLVLFTDGVTEAENEEEEQLGLQPVATLVSTLHGTPAPRILETIESTVQAFSGTAAASDDVTMLALTRA